MPCLVLTLRNSFSLFSRMMYGRLCDYCISTDSYVYAGVCVGGRSRRHDADSLKIGQHNRMSPTCRADIVDMLATDKNVCRLRGGADRHKSRHCQPRFAHLHQVKFQPTLTNLGSVCVGNDASVKPYAPPQPEKALKHLIYVTWDAV